MVIMVTMVEKLLGEFHYGKVVTMVTGVFVCEKKWLFVLRSGEQCLPTLFGYTG